MANIIRQKFTGIASTSSTAVENVGSLDFGNVPGFGNLAALSQFAFIIKSRVMVLSNGGDHGSKFWVLQTAGYKNAGGGFGVLATPVSDTDASGGVITNNGTDSNGTFAYDVSGNLVRFRITPASGNSMVWFAEHDCTIFAP